MIDINAIIEIESSGDPKAFNKTSGARGLCQITPAALEDWNALQSHRGVFQLSQLFNGSINRLVGDWYLNFRIPWMLEQYGLELTVANILTAYNWGIGNLVKFLRHPERHCLPNETKEYIKKYNSLVKK